MLAESRIPESNRIRTDTNGEHDLRADAAWWRCRESNPQGLLARQDRFPKHIPVAGLQGIEPG